MQKWKKFCNLVFKTEKFTLYLAVICLLAMTCLVCVEIIGRTFFSFSTLIADEYTGYFVAALTFFGGAYSLHSGSFIRVDIFYHNFKGIPKRVIDIYNETVGLVFLLFLMYFCFTVFRYSLVNGVVSPDHSKTPLIYPQAVMLIGCPLMIFQQFIELVNAIVGEGKHVAGNKEER